MMFFQVVLKMWSIYIKRKEIMNKNEKQIEMLNTLFDVNEELELEELIENIQSSIEKIKKIKKVRLKFKI